MCESSDILKAMQENKVWKDAHGNLRKMYGVTTISGGNPHVLVDHFPKNQPPFLDRVPLSQISKEDIVSP